MLCPLCESECAEDALDCAQCGKQLLVELIPDDAPEMLAGQEHTQVGADDLDTAFAMAALDPATIPALDGIERTQLAEPTLQVAIEPLQVDGSQPAASSAPSIWTAELLEIDSGRDEDLAPRTPEPEETNICPWCGAPATGAVCSHCGRRRRRFTRDPSRPIASAGETTLCPACFSRVAADDRCAQCHAPLPRSESL